MQTNILQFVVPTKYEELIKYINMRKKTNKKKTNINYDR